jgi:hypothetical protein
VLAAWLAAMDGAEVLENRRLADLFFRPVSGG